MTDLAVRRKKARREAYAWVSFALFLTASLMLGSIFVFRDLPAQLGIDMERRLIGWEPFVVLGSVLLVGIILVYIGAIAWLLFARMFFTKSEVSKVAFYRSNTRFDRWLVDSLFREDH